MIAPCGTGPLRSSAAFYELGVPLASLSHLLMCCTCTHSRVWRYSASPLLLKGASAGPCSTSHCSCLSCVAVCRSGSLPRSSATFFSVVPAHFSASRLLVWTGPLSQCSLQASMLLPVPALRYSHLALLQWHALSPSVFAPVQLRDSSVLPLLALLPIRHASTFSGCMGPRSHLRQVSVACAAPTPSTAASGTTLSLGLLSGCLRRPSSSFYWLLQPCYWRGLLVRAFPPWSSPFGDFLQPWHVARIPPQSAQGSLSVLSISPPFAFPCPATGFLASS